MSSKFSSPFFKKSPLYGAYASGAGGMINVSYNDIHQKFQNDIGENVDRAYTKEKNPCDNLDQKLADGDILQGAHAILSKKCAEPQDTSSSESILGRKPFDDVNRLNKTKPFEGASVSDYKKSNKTNPYYIGKGYESPYTIDLPELPNLG